MDHSYSDLEEGEIVDDSPPSLDFDINQRKELPRRYVVKDNKSPLHKHKKKCKHAIRHHAKKLSKLKKTPNKQKSSPRCHNKYANEKYKFLDRYNSWSTFKHVLPKNSHFSTNSLMAEMKGSFKNASPPKKLSTNLNKSRSQKIPTFKRSFKTSENDIATSEISCAKMLKNDDNSVANKASINSECLAGKTDSNVYLIDLTKSSPSDDPEISIIELPPSDIKPPLLIDISESPDNSISSITELISDNDEKNNNAISNIPLHIKEEESEDEEELRRIALATCANRKALIEPTNSNENVDSTCSVPVPDIPCVENVQISHEEISNPTADNYEVVDMEVDEEMPDPLEVTEILLVNQKSEHTENLFVIDTNPSKDFQKNKNSTTKEQMTRNSDDEDFEADLLRAELINSMYRKKLLQEDPKPELSSKQKLNAVVHEKQMSLVQQKKSLVNYQKRNLMFSYKRLKSAKHFLRKRSVNKLVNIKNNNSSNNSNNKVLIPVQPTKPSERLIITVNEDSSDDSDDNSDEETSAVSENPVDSIVALISDCRQKSESSAETKTNEAVPKEEKEVVPKAVSCLSKAQQEEYNSLMKILAKKNKLPTTEATVPIKNGSVHSPLDDLKKLEEKLVVLRNALTNKKESMTHLSKDIKAKKFQYMKAKLSAQLLKEQFVAAEKVRKTKLLEWSGTCDKLKLMKQSVSDLESKINEIQTLCSKIGSSLQGQSFTIAQLSSGNKQS